MKKFLSVILVLLISIPLFSFQTGAEESALLSEGFEGNGIPSGWTVEYDEPEYAWFIGTGDYDVNTGSHGGDQNALTYHYANDLTSVLVSPELDLTGLPYVVLNFWYINRAWVSDVDYLSVFFRLPDGSEIQLFSTELAHEEWTEAKVIIPVPSSLQTSGLSLCFRTTDNWGYGVGLDDVSMTGYTEFNMVTLSYNANGGEGFIPTEASSSGDTFTVAENRFDYPDHVFLSWNTAPDGSGDTYFPGDEITPEEDTVLYARWGFRGFSESFEDEDALGDWTFIDADDDGENWFVWTYADYAHTGSSLLTSASYNGNPLFPDNWAITPALVIPKDAELSFWIRAQDPAWPDELLNVYIGDNASPDGMVQIGSDIYATGEYVEYRYDLSAYTGQTKYIGFRHHDVSDMFRIDLDDVMVSGSAPADPAFKCCTLLLTGQIGVNFYADLSRLTEEEREAVTVEFSVNGVTTTDTFDAACTDPDGHGYYGFTCFVNSIEMADEITATLYFGEGGEVSTEYSVQNYVDYVLENTEDFSGEVVSLVEAIADYGHYVQLFLEPTHDWTLGVDHETMLCANELDGDDVEAAREAVSDRAPALNCGESAVEGAGFSLVLDSETTLRLFLRVRDGYTGDAAATCNGDDVACVQQTSGRYLVEIADIPAFALGDTYDITISADGEATVSLSALSYAYAVLNAESGPFDTDEARLAATALYRYYAAARAYFLSVTTK